MVVYLLYVSCHKGRAQHNAEQVFVWLHLVSLQHNFSKIALRILDMASTINAIQTLTEYFCGIRDSKTKKDRGLRPCLWLQNQEESSCIGTVATQMWEHVTQFDSAGRMELGACGVNWAVHNVKISFGVPKGTPPYRPQTWCVLS